MIVLSLFCFMWHMCFLFAKLSKRTQEVIQYDATDKSYTLTTNSVFADYYHKFSP